MTDDDDDADDDNDKESQLSVCTIGVTVDGTLNSS